MPQNLNIKVTAQDEASPTLDSLKARFAALHGEVDALGAQSAAAQTEVGGIGSAGTAAGGEMVAGMGLAAAAVAAVTVAAAAARTEIGFIVSSIRVASETVQNATTARFQNTLSQIAGVWTSFQQTIGLSLMSSLQGPLDTIRGAITNILSALQPIVPVAAVMLEVVATIAAGILGYIGDRFNDLRIIFNAIGPVAVGIANTIGSAVTAAANAAITAINNLLDGLASNPIIAFGLAKMGVSGFGHISTLTWTPLEFKAIDLIQPFNAKQQERKTIAPKTPTIPSGGGGVATTTTPGTHATATVSHGGPTISATPQSNMAPVNITVQVLTQQEGLQELLDKFDNLPTKFRDALLTYTAAGY